MTTTPNPEPGDPTGPAPATPATSRYVRPGRGTDLFNALIGRATRLGIAVFGSRELRVRGRSSGEWRRTPVNPLTLDGVTYLVAPRGNTQWVRNLRAAGGGELVHGRRGTPFQATELPDDAKPAILRAYLRKWRFEVGVFFDGVGPDAGDADLRAIAPGYPVFQLSGN
jgi:deazaflavin-dependent oxidoreductase (nitroreductase family)